MELQTPYRSPVNAVLAQEATRAFMARVYGWMFAGLAVSGVVSIYASQSEAVLSAMLGLHPAIPFLVMIGFTWFVSARLPSMSAQAAGTLFLVYASMLGVFLAPIFLIYQLGSISRVFFLSASMFGALSVFAMVTKKDLSGMATFLFMGLWGIVAAVVINMIWPMPMLSFVTACAGVVVFSGLAAYDTQKLKNIGAEAEASGARGMAVAGALHLYLDFINLFLSLLRLFGSRR